MKFTKDAFLPNDKTCTTSLCAVYQATYTKGGKKSNIGKMEIGEEEVLVGQHQGRTKRNREDDEDDKQQEQQYHASQSTSTEGGATLHTTSSRGSISAASHIIDLPVEVTALIFEWLSIVDDEGGDLFRVRSICQKWKAALVETLLTFYPDTTSLALTCGEWFHDIIISLKATKGGTWLEAVGRIRVEQFPEKGLSISAAMKQRKLFIVACGTQLETLDMDDGNLKFTSFEFLSTVGQTLKELKFWCDDHQAHVGASAIRQLNKLEKLSIGWTTFTSLDFLAHGCSGTLKELDCSGCKKLTDEGARAIGKLQQLQKLDIGRTQLTNWDFISDIRGSLRELNCSFCNLSGDQVAQLGHLDRLQRLDMAGNTNSGGLGFLKSLSSTLKELACSNCTQLTDNETSSIGVLQNLETLGISNTGVTHLNFLNNSSIGGTLTSLSCAYCKSLSEIDPSVFSQLIKLEKLDIRETKISNLEFLGEVGGSLKELLCSRCEELSDAAGSSIQRLEKLENLSIGKTRFTNLDFLKPLGKNLKRLYCASCSQLKDASAIWHLKVLEFLDVRWTCIENFDFLRGLCGGTLKELWCDVVFELTDAGLKRQLQASGTKVRI